MAAPATSSILRAPGVLIWNPTDLGQAEPYGGTYLGSVRGIAFTPNPIYEDIIAEEWGTPEDVLYEGEHPCEIRATVRYPDSDMLTTVAAKSISPGSQGVAFLFRPGGTTQNTKPGTFVGDLLGGKLLFAPRAAAAHPFVILYRAVPMISQGASMRFSWNEEWGLDVVFRGTVDSSGRVYQHGRLGTLVL